MEISVTDAEARLDELVQRAEAGEEIVLTDLGRPAVRLIALRSVEGSEMQRGEPDA